MTRTICLTLAGIMLATTPALAESTATRPAGRPNIVLFLSDDHTWHDCGPYGGRDVRTPNLDRLAEESLVFDLAFSASPTCAPSRSALYTGLFPFRNGAHANHSLVRDGLRSWPHYFRDLGYRVVIAGKTHIGPREVFPFEYLPESNIMPPGKKHVLWTDLGVEAIAKLLTEHDRAQPLCLIVCSHSPHTIWPPADGYHPADLVLPPYLLDTPETRRARARYLTDVTWMDGQVGQVRAALQEHGYADNTLFMYAADQGAQWPFSKWNLYDLGIRVPLIVHWPGHVRPGRTRAMVSLIDLLPTCVAAAGGTPPTDIDGRSFLGVLRGETQRHRDVTFASHTGDGAMNQAPMRCIRTERYKYILNLAPEIKYTTHVSKGEGATEYWASWVRLAERDERAATVVRRYEHRPPAEFYDLEADPFEEKNLIDAPEHQERIAQLREQLKAWRVQQGEDLDRVPMPEDARRGPLKYAG